MDDGIYLSIISQKWSFVIKIIGLDIHLNFTQGIWDVHASLQEKTQKIQDYLEKIYTTKYQKE